MQYSSLEGRSVRASMFALALWVCASCGSDPSTTSTTASASKPGSDSTEAATAATTSTRTPPEQTPAALASGALVCAPQHGWFVERPLNATRVAQYRLPRVGQDSEDASLVVSFFSGQGGSRDANVKRWSDQFEQADGRTSSEAMESSERTVNGMRVFEVALSGTYIAETSPGSGERYHKEGWRMLAAIVDAPLGPHYLKLTGPEATVREWEPSYRSFVSALKAQP